MAGSATRQGVIGLRLVIVAGILRITMVGIIYIVYLCIGNSTDNCGAGAGVILFTGSKCCCNQHNGGGNFLRMFHNRSFLQLTNENYANILQSLICQHNFNSITNYKLLQLPKSIVASFLFHFH